MTLYRPRLIPTLPRETYKRELFSLGFLLPSLLCYRSRPQWGQEQRKKFLETARQWLNTSACMNRSPKHFLCSGVLQCGKDRVSAQTVVSGGEGVCTEGMTRCLCPAWP